MSLPPFDTLLVCCLCISGTIQLGLLPCLLSVYFRDYTIRFASLFVVCVFQGLYN